MSKKIHKLSVTLKQEFAIIGISSHENDYRLTWALNNNTGFDFYRDKNFIVHNENSNEKQEYSCYRYEDEERFLKFVLYSNQSEYGYLIPDFKNLDFLLLVFGETSDQYIQKLVQKIKNIDIVITAFKINNIPKKSIKRLIR